MTKQKKKKTKPTKVKLVALKMVNFLPKQNATYMSGTPLPILLRFNFTPTPKVCTYVRTGVRDVITKFSGIDRFPLAIGMGLWRPAPLASG